MKTIANIIHQKTFHLLILDNNGNAIYGENSDGFWVKRQYDTNDKQTYFESSSGYIEDNR